MLKRKLRMGMIGGGKNAFIGAIHRTAAFMDNHIELVCGCFSSDAEESFISGRSYYLPDHRIYGTYDEMLKKESSLPENERMDFVSIVTPNHLHFDPAMKALDYGFHVVLDKPMCFSLDEAYGLKKKVDETGLVLALTHVYSAYPAIKEARHLVESGELGVIRKIWVEYPQGWLSDRIELQRGNNAGWRTDPSRSGKAGCTGDIGTHAFHLAEYVSGMRCTALCADLKTFVRGRLIDDDGTALLRFENEATGVLTASQVAAGEENAIRLRIYGEKGGLEWNQQEPNTLIFKHKERPAEYRRTGNGYMCEAAKSISRTPGGHPEGFIEAFANIYRNFAFTVQALKDHETPKREWLDFPTVNDGVRGMQFIETMVKSGYDDDTKWTEWIQ